MLRKLREISMSNDKKYLSTLLDRFFPQYIQSEYSQFVLFFQKFFEYCEQTNNIIDLITTLTDIIDIDKITDDPYGYGQDILNLYIAQYLSQFPTYRIQDIDVRKVIKHARDIYSSKGTEKSFQTVFRILNHTGAFSFYYPSKDILYLNDSTNGLLNSNKKIHDNRYYAHYTYEISSSLYDHSEIKDIIESFLHPVGCKVFYRRLVESISNDDFNSVNETSNDVGKLDNIVNCFETYNDIYLNGNITFENVETLDANLFLSINSFDDLNDIFYNLENPSDEWFYYALNAELTSI
jgi:hypothetical protein